MSDEDKDSEDMNQKIVRIGGTALLLTSVITSATVAIGKNQIAQRAAKKGEAVDVAAMNEGSQMAMRALKRATMYNIIGFGGVIGLGCLYFNIRSFQDFRSVIKSVKGVQISKKDAKPTTWEDIYPDDKKK